MTCVGPGAAHQLQSASASQSPFILRNRHDKIPQAFSANVRIETLMQKELVA